MQHVIELADKIIQTGIQANAGKIKAICLKKEEIIVLLGVVMKKEKATGAKLLQFVKTVRIPNTNK